MTRSNQRTIITRHDDHEQRFIAMLVQGAEDGSLRPVDIKLAVYRLMVSINISRAGIRPRAAQQ